MSTHVLRLIREDDFRYDPYGTAMSWWFAIADYLHDHDPDAIPAYRPSPVGTHDDTHEYNMLSILVDARDASTDTLVHAGNVLARYVDMLARYGRSY